VIKGLSVDFSSPIKSRLPKFKEACTRWRQWGVLR